MAQVWSYRSKHNQSRGDAVSSNAFEMQYQAMPSYILAFYFQIQWQLSKKSKEYLHNISISTS